MKIQYLSILLLALFISCQPDEVVAPESIQDSYRILRSTISQNGVNQAKHEYVYDGIMVSEVKFYQYMADSGIWYNMYNTAFSYDGIIVTAIVYSAMGEPMDKGQYTVENGILMEEINFAYLENEWQKEIESKFYYTSQGIDSTIDKVYSMGVQSYAFKRVFDYSDGEISLENLYRLEGDGIWNNIQRANFSYENQSFGFVKYNILDDELNETWKEVNYLDDGFIAKKESSMFWAGEYWEISSVENYKYNSEGLLSERQYDALSENSITTMEYEPGAGNLSWFYRPEITYYAIPMPRKNILIPSFLSNLK